MCSSDLSHLLALPVFACFSFESPEGCVSSSCLSVLLSIYIALPILVLVCLRVCCPSSDPVDVHLFLPLPTPPLMCLTIIQNLHQNLVLRTTSSTTNLHYGHMTVFSSSGTSMLTSYTATRRIHTCLFIPLLLSVPDGSRSLCVLCVTGVGL